MIRLLGISGSPVKGGNVEMVLNWVETQVAYKNDVQLDVVTLAGKNISGCNHCNWCVKHQSKGRFCVLEDDMTLIYPRLLEADGILLATPVHFGRLSGLLANMIDRLRVFRHGRLYKDCLRNKVGGGLAVAFMRGGGIEATLATLNATFFLFEMIIATSRMYQLGAAAHSSLEGTGKIQKGVRHLVLKDVWGMTSIGLLLERMIEIITIVKRGKKEQEA